MAATAREQLLLELINEARLDPLGNAARYISSCTGIPGAATLIADLPDGSLLLATHFELK